MWIPHTATSGLKTPHCVAHAGKSGAAAVGPAVEGRAVAAAEVAVARAAAGAAGGAVEERGAAAEAVVAGWRRRRCGDGSGGSGGGSVSRTLDAGVVCAAARAIAAAGLRWRAPTAQLRAQLIERNICCCCSVWPVALCPTARAARAVRVRHDEQEDG